VREDHAAARRRVGVHSILHEALAATRQGELIADAGRRELVRLAREANPRPTLLERVARLRPEPKPAPYRRDWLIGRAVTQS